MLSFTFLPLASTLIKNAHCSLADPFLSVQPFCPSQAYVDLPVVIGANVSTTSDYPYKPLNDTIVGLTLASGIDLVAGINPVPLGNLSDVDSKYVNWTIIFANAGAFTVDVNATGYYNGTDYAFSHESATITVLVRDPHDLAVSLETPASMDLSESALLNVTAYNVGLNTEYDVVLLLIIDGTLVDGLTIPELKNNSSSKISYSFTAPAAKTTLNVTAFVSPAQGEVTVANNVATEMVGVPKKRILLDTTHGCRGISSFTFFVDSLRQRGYNVSEHTSGPISSMALEGNDVLLIIDAKSRYTSTELSTIRNFIITHGLGLMVVGGANPANTYNDFTEFTGIYWTKGGVVCDTANIKPHEITEGVSQVHLVNPYNAMNVTDLAQDIVRDTSQNIMVSISESYGRVVGFADYNSLMNYDNVYQILYKDNLRLANNIVDWLAAPPGRHEHELAVTVESPRYVDTGNVTLLNATVYNAGLFSESDVKLYLSMNGTTVSSATIPELPADGTNMTSYLWTPTSSGICNVTAYAPSVAEEAHTTNNVASRIVGIFFYRQQNSTHEWTDSGSPMGWHGDDISRNYTLSFDFPFYGVNCRTIYISSNGLMAFTWPDTTWTNSLQELSKKLAIAPAWDDWVTYDPNEIFIWQDSTHVGIRWFVNRFSPSNVTANFEAILSKDGTIQFNYEFTNGTNSATIGISNGEGHILAFDAIDLNYTDTILFTPYGFGDFEVLVSPTSRSIYKGQSTTYSVNATSTDGFNSSISLSLSGLPQNASYTFDPEVVTPPVNGSARSTLQVFASPTAPPGTYNLTIAGSSDIRISTSNVTLIIMDDINPPTINNVTQTPGIMQVQPWDNVTVSANVTDSESGVDIVILSYSTSGGAWQNVTMIFNSTTKCYEGVIQNQTLGTHVQYKIIAYDRASTVAINDNGGIYYVYDVPEFGASWLLIIVLSTITIVMALARTVRRRKANTGTTNIRKAPFKSVGLE